MAHDVTEDLLEYVQERTGLSRQGSVAAVVAVREWLESRLGNRDDSGGRDLAAEDWVRGPRAS